MNTTEHTSKVRALPPVKISKANRQRFADWTARIEAEGLQVGMVVTVTRVTTDERNYVLTKWEEPATITELRNFDALVQFADGTLGSSGLGMRVSK